MLDIAVIIIGYKTKEFIKNCLESLRRDAYNTHLNYKVIVVDNNSQDGTIEMLARDFSEVVCLASPENLGYPRAVNLAIRSFKAKYYLVLNPDTLFTIGDTLGKLYDFAEKNPTAGLIGPKLLNPDGTIQMSCFRFPNFLMPLYRRTFLRRLPWIKKIISRYLMEDWDHATPQPVDWVLGGQMLVRHSAIEKIGLMDERFFMFFEDVDWCRRFWRANWQVLYAADIQLIHYHLRPSAGRNALRDFFTNRVTRIHIQSWIKYTLKYFFKLPAKNFYRQNTMENLIQENSSTQNTDPIKTTRETARKSHHRWLGWILGLLAAAILVFIIWPFGRLAFHTWRGALSIQSAYQKISALDFESASPKLQAGLKHWESARYALGNLSYWQKIGVINTDTYSSSNQLLSVAYALTNDVMIANDWAQTNIAPIKTSGQNSVSEINSDLKTNLLNALSQSDPLLYSIDSDLSLQISNLQKISSSRANPFLIKISSRLIDILQPAQENLTTTRQFLPMAVSALGYPESRDYLFILQNNGEMRPTGGYIGTYGFFKVQNGEFVEFTTANTYHLNLDGARYVSQSAPESLRRYLGATRWLLDTSNWSPDFPTAAAQIEKSYQTESRDTRYLDGLVAMDPKPIVELLALTGPIEIDGQNFTAENFVDTMEAYTYSEFAKEGVASRDRKNLIGQLGVQMIDHFLHSSLGDWLKVAQIVTNNLDEKHIIFNFKNTVWQDLLASKNWDGSVQSNYRDYLMVVDANLNSLKTDRWTEKSITYHVSRDTNQNYIGTVTLTYKNTAATITEKTKALKEYTRIYTPNNSRLISCALNNQFIKTDITQELGHSVFGNLINVDLGQTSTLICSYQLPAEIMSDENYELLVQKQAGTLATPFTFQLELNSQNPQTVENTLNTDKTYRLELGE